MRICKCRRIFQSKTRFYFATKAAEFKLFVSNNIGSGFNAATSRKEIAIHSLNMRLH